MLAKIGVWEVMAIVAIVVFVFGSKRLPALGKSMGETLRNFKSSAKGEDIGDDIDK